jgi:hypothetical protein
MEGKQFSAAIAANREMGLSGMSIRAQRSRAARPESVTNPAAAMSALGHVWTAPPWQELSELLQHWSGAVMCPACLCGGEAAGHNALRGSGPNR